jgi:poly(3-hydroxyalkanoate) synthetase
LIDVQSSVPLFSDLVLTPHRAKQIEQAYALCPNTKLVASGYSQGGQLVHNAAELLPQNVAEWISSVVIFGDPGIYYQPL